MRILLTVFFFFTWFYWVGAQNRLGFEYTDEFEVLQNGDTLKHAWAGGLNWVQFSTIDLNMDGVEDLLAFDRAGNRISPFLKVANNGVFSYQYAPEYISKFPQIEEWMLLVDFNCDGKKDIFCYVPNGVGVFENTSSNNQLSFTWALNFPYLTTEYGSGPVNLFVRSTDIPAIVDVDSDGDIDILTNGMSASVFEWHENSDSCGLNFYINTYCWGRFVEDLFSNQVSLNACTVQKNEAGAGGSIMGEKTQHAGSTILLLDLTNNGLKDAILSDVDSRNSKGLYNTGKIDSAFISSQDTLFPSSNTPINMFLFPGNFYEDVTHDGVKDLLVSPNTNSTKNKNSVWLYKNLGTNTLPDFSLIDTSFLQRDMIDFGEGAYPIFVDLDVDGRIDLLSSNMGLFQDSGIYRSSIHYYRNVGTQTNPRFQLITDNLANITQYNLGMNIIPAFGDLDGDFDVDMIIGTADGRIHYFENNGSISNPNFILKNANLQGIDVGSNAAPTLFDLDGDGYLDLVIGEQDGNLNYYKNNGSTNLSFTFENDNLGGVNVSTTTAFTSNSVPLFYEHNDTVLLFVGSTGRGIVQYDSITQVMNQPSFIEDDFGTGTTATTNSNLTPFGATRRNGRNQILYRASELKAMGFTYGTIKYVAFYVPINPTNALSQGFTMRMKNVNMNSISGWETGMTQVYNQLHAFYNGWNEINLSTPFIWDGVSDLLIEICFSRNFPSQDIPVLVSDVGWPANAYGDVLNWNNVTQNGCDMPYLATSTLRPNMRMRLVPTFFEVGSILKDGTHNAIAIAELNGDSYPEGILGNWAGGLTFYKGVQWVNTVSVDEFKPRIKQGMLHIYPNPTTGEINILLPDDVKLHNASLFIYDFSGRVVRQSLVEDNVVTTDLSGFLPGFYFVTVNDGTNVWRGKVVLR